MTAQRTTQGNTGALMGFVDDLNGAIRENPVAAGLIGMGVLWMFGGARISALGGKLPSAARTVTRAVGAATEATGSVVGDALAGTGSRVSDAARQVGDAISSGTEGAATFVRDKFSDGYDALTSSGEKATETLKQTIKGSGGSSVEFGTSMQQNLAQTLKRQPLLLGVIGLALGAGIATAFPSTKKEQEVMGEAGMAVKNKIQEIAAETTEFASERAKQVLNEVKEEAVAQGLTPAAAKESLKGMAEKVKIVAGASRESIKDRLPKS